MRRAGIPLGQEREDKHHLRLCECDVRGRFTCGVVREPLSWWRSQYHYRRKMRFGDSDHVWYDRWLDLPFDDFLRQVTEQEPGAVWGFYDYYLDLGNGGPDYVGRIEHLAEDCIEVARLTGYSVDEGLLRNWPKRNVSVSAPAPTPPDWLVRAESRVYERFYPHVLAAVA